MSSFCQAVGVSLGLLVMMMTGVSAQVDCIGRPDGAYDNGCSSCIICAGGQGKPVVCPPDYVINQSAGVCACEPWDQVPPPCGSNNCTGHPDGLYPAEPDCRYFYTCQNEEFIGAFPCNNPPDIGDLVFDFDMQVCNWYWAVPPPCGTAPEKKPFAQFKSKEV